MRRLFLAVATATLLTAPLAAQAGGPKSTKPSESPLAKAAAALPFRSIGPGVMSGRLSDVEVHPTAPGVWYVAAGSGGVWKTTNAGTTWTSIFEDQPSYSIGEITLLDPTNLDDDICQRAVDRRVELGEAAQEFLALVQGESQGS